MAESAVGAVERRGSVAVLTPVIARGAEVLHQEVALGTGQTLVLERARTGAAARMAISTFVQSIVCIVLRVETFPLAESIRSQLEVEVDTGETVL